MRLSAEMECYVDRRMMTLYEVDELSLDQRGILESAHVRDLIFSGMLSIKEALQLSSDQLMLLKKHVFCSLMAEKWVVFDQILRLNPKQCAMLGSDTFNERVADGTISPGEALCCLQLESSAILFKMIIDGVLTFDQILQFSPMQCHLLLGERDIRALLGDGNITPEELLQFSLDPSECEKLEREGTELFGALVHQAGTWFTDPGSGTDRGESKVDLEQLQARHKDELAIHDIKEIAMLKLPIVVREEAEHYLKNADNAHLIPLVKTGGVKVIWSEIRNAVVDRMFNKFGSLYVTGSDPSFIGLIDLSQNINLDGLSCFQVTIQWSVDSDSCICCKAGDASQRSCRAGEAEQRDGERQDPRTLMQGYTHSVHAE